MAALTQWSRRALSSAAIRKDLPAGTRHTQIAHQCRNAFFTSFKFIARSFSSYPSPLFQNEVKCEVFDSVFSISLIIRKENTKEINV